MSPTFQAFISRARSATTNERCALVDDFMEQQKTKGFPDVDESHVHFIYRGSAADRVAVTGDHLHWSLAGEQMQLLEGTDFHYLGKRFEPDARLDYKFIVNDRWIIDPLNPYESAGGFGLNSELRMPAYAAAPELVQLTSSPGGTMTALTLKSGLLPAFRQISVYLPEGHRDGESPMPVAFFNDGTEYLSLAMTKNILDNLIDQKKIVPLIAVFIPPGNREQEFRMTRLEAYSKFLIDEVLPAITAGWKISSSASERAIIGASDGGHAALWIALSHPDVFGMAGTQSATITDRLQALVSGTTVEGRKFALDCGRYDLTGFLDHHYAFSRLLRDCGGNVYSTEWNEGHSWGNWRAHLGAILSHLFPPK